MKANETGPMPFGWLQLFFVKILNRSLVECASACSTNGYCSAFQMNRKIGVCQLGYNYGLKSSLSDGSTAVHINPDYNYGF